MPVTQEQQALPLLEKLLAEGDDLQVDDLLRSRTRSSLLKDSLPKAMACRPLGSCKRSKIAKNSLPKAMTS